MNWLNPTTLARPQRNDFPTTADFMLADGVWTSLQNADLNFLAAAPDAEYVSPQAYVAAMTAYAQTLLQNRFPVPYAPVGWDPAKAARAACSVCFNSLAQVPVTLGDPETVSVFMAWMTGKGSLLGGHDPIPAPVAPSAPSGPAQDGTIFAH